MAAAHSRSGTGDTEDSLNEIAEMLRGIRPEFDFALSSDFFTDGMLDSLDLVMLVSALEQRFSVSIEGTDIVLENLRNIGCIRALLEKYGVKS
jgi:acyl carrier protein